MARMKKSAEQAPEGDSPPAVDPSSYVLGSVLEFVTDLQRVDMKPRQVQWKIDGLVYTSTKLPATIGLEIWPRLAALIGAGLTRAIATGDAGDLTGEMLLRIATRAMNDGLVPLVKDLLGRMKCGKLAGTGKPGDVLDDFDEHFAGEYGHLLKVAAFAVAHNLRGPTYGAR